MKQYIATNPYSVVRLLVTIFVLQTIFFSFPNSLKGSSPSPDMAVDILNGNTMPVSGSPAPSSEFPRDYRTVGSVEGRSVLWVVIEQHFLLGSLLLGAPFLSFLLELFGQFRRKSLDRSERYHRLGKEVLHFILPYYTLTILSGGLLLAAFVYLYPVFFDYMLGLFKPVVALYAIAFLLESLLLYLYYYGWDRLSTTNNGRWMHLSVGALLNTNGLLIIYWANSWMAFMMSPGGVDIKGRFLGDIWGIIHTPIWHPLNVHRILASLMFGAVVIGALSAYRFLRSENSTERAYYDWVGSVMTSIVVISICILPFAGYWFAKVIFSYRQRMGVALMGGELSWLFVVQAMLIGAIFMVIVYYLWQGMARMEGSARYYPMVKYLLITLVVSLLVWSTPHTLPGTPQEFKAMGSTQHPVIGNYGVMAAKNTAINTIILTIALCLMIYQRCNKTLTTPWARQGNMLLVMLFIVAEANILFLGIYGFYVPARIRVALSLPQFVTALMTLAIGYSINWFMLRSAKSLGPIRWGRLPRPGAYSLYALAALVTLTMVLMGYIRSSVRLDWHINEIMRDTSPWANALPMGDAFGIIFVNLVLFWGMVFFVQMLVHRGQQTTPVFDISDSLSFPSKSTMDLVPPKTSQSKI